MNRSDVNIQKYAKYFASNNKTDLIRNALTTDTQSISNGRALLPENLANCLSHAHFDRGDAFLLFGRVVKGYKVPISLVFARSQV